MGRGAGRCTRVAVGRAELGVVAGPLVLSRDLRLVGLYCRRHAEAHASLPAQPADQYDPAPQGGCDYEVASVYLWTVGGSWDVLGL